MRLKCLRNEGGLDGNLLGKPDGIDEIGIFVGPEEGSSVGIVVLGVNEGEFVIGLLDGITDGTSH